MGKKKKGWDSRRTKDSLPWDYDDKVWETFWRANVNRIGAKKVLEIFKRNSGGELGEPW